MFTTGGCQRVRVPTAQGRRKGSPSIRGRLSIRVDRRSICLLFGIRQTEAAKRLAISLTALK